MRHATLIALLALAPGLSAQITEAQAVQKARAASKAALATLKVEVSAARQQCFADIAAFEAQFKLGNGVLADVGELQAALASLQQTVQVKVNEAVFDASLAASLALTELADGTPLLGNQPPELQIGTGGVFDDTNAAIDKLLAKTYRALDKRLDKTEALVAAAGNVRLRVSIRPPGGCLPHGAADGAFVILDADLDIDLLCAARDTVLDDSGVIFAAGSDATVLEGDGLKLDFTHCSTSSGYSFSQDAQGQGQRWTAEVQDLGQGIYACRIRPTESSAYRAWSISIP
jgi:hypothetical protein